MTTIREHSPLAPSRERRIPGPPPSPAELAARLRRLTDLWADFITYYDIPRSHPDAELILREVRAARILLDRLLGPAPGEEGR